MNHLFSKFKLRRVEFRNRIFVSPMCQYSSRDGVPTPWHLVHLGSRAVGGAGLVMVEASAVSPEGRITPWDSGFWSEEQGQAFREITHFISEQGAVPGIQLAHAGRKASTDVPWKGGEPLSDDAGGWKPIAPSAIPFGPGHPVPKEMNAADMGRIADAFAQAAHRAAETGFQVVELHMAHGYLLHEFLSPLSNRRSDDFGGSFENRTRFPLRVTQAVREVWPAHLPLFVRLSATDWVEGGWDLGQTVTFVKMLKEIGVDFLDCSSGGLVPDAKIPFGPGYQVPFSEAIRKEAKIATGAVGLITKAGDAERILAEGKADAVFLARQFLRDPYFPLHAAKELGMEGPWPNQYLRAKET